jgi:hypothetical protein
MVARIERVVTYPYEITYLDAISVCRWKRPAARAYLVNDFLRYGTVTHGHGLLNMVMSEMVGRIVLPLTVVIFLDKLLDWRDSS